MNNNSCLPLDILRLGRIHPDDSTLTDSPWSSWSRIAASWAPSFARTVLWCSLPNSVCLVLCNKREPVAPAAKQSFSHRLSLGDRRNSLNTTYSRACTFSSGLGASTGVSGLEWAGVCSGVVDSIEGTKLPTPLDSLLVLGEIGPQPVNVLKPCSYKILVPNTLNSSGSRPESGRAIDSAILCSFFRSNLSRNGCCLKLARWVFQIFQFRPRCRLNWDDRPR